MWSWGTPRAEPFRVRGKRPKFRTNAVSREKGAGQSEQAMGSEVGQAIVNSVAAQAMEVDYGHVDVTGVSSGGIKPVDVHAAPLVSVNGGGQSVMMGVDKGVRTTSVGMIEPWSVEEDRE